MQECLVHWLSVRGDIDPSRATTRTAFMARVVHNKLMDLVRERESDKRRASYDSVSLDEPLGEHEGSSSMLAHTDDAQNEQQGRALGEDARIDLANALNRLTPRQRRLCQLLREHGLNVQEASRKLGIPRPTLYDELKRIRKVFAALGLKDYLKG